MTVFETLSKNSIAFAQMGNELVIQCPFCEKAIAGNPTATFHINNETGIGECHDCTRRADWAEICRDLEINEPDVQKKKVQGYKKRIADKVESIELKESPRQRIAKLEKPSQKITFEEWRQVIQSNYPDLTFAAEVGLSIITQILIKDITNPFALIYVDAPSSGKTLVINFFSGMSELTYATDRFTTASFVSSASNVETSKLEKIDLLPKLQYKMFLLRDMATVFSKRDDELTESLGILTRVLDGEGLSTESGVHGQRGYSGEYLFMVLGGSTPLQKRVWRVMGSLGSRLFFLSINSKNKSEDELVMQLQSEIHSLKSKKCQEATTNLLRTLWNTHANGIEWDKGLDNKTELTIIAKCAKLLAKLRGVIAVWEDKLDSFSNDSTYNHSVPIIEKPDRINQLLYNLCRGNALKRGRVQIQSSDLKEAIELTIDSAPTNRATLFRKLIEHGGTMKTTEVESELGCSKPHALKEMATLKILGVAYIKNESYGKVGEPEQEINLTTDFMWFTSEECQKIRGIEIEEKKDEETQGEIPFSD